MAMRGGPKFACMAPIKAALRSLGQAMYQTYAPKGVHVAHVVIDGVIESPNTKAWASKVMLQDPADLADAFFALHEQKPSVWSYAPWMHQGFSGADVVLEFRCQEIQLTPCRESVGMNKPVRLLAAVFRSCDFDLCERCFSTAKKAIENFQRLGVRAGGVGLDTLMEYMESWRGRGLFLGQTGDVRAGDIWLWLAERSGSSKGRQTMLTACNPISRRCLCCSRFVAAELCPFLSVSQLASCFGSRQHRLASFGNRLLQAWRDVSEGLECLTLTAVMYMLLLLSLPLECSVGRHLNDKNLCRTEASGRASAARLRRCILDADLSSRASFGEC
ncbi:unnamed protein product [Symbiodinium sp. CCMP2592]|nr:unnamed protein product [Symbiodinium sp. CCMP2592]